MRGFINFIILCIAFSVVGIKNTNHIFFVFSFLFFTLVYILINVFYLLLLSVYSSDFLTIAEVWLYVYILTIFYWFLVIKFGTDFETFSKKINMSFLVNLFLICFGCFYYIYFYFSS